MSLLDLQSQYESEGFETSRIEYDLYTRLSISKEESDSWIIVSANGREFGIKVLFKENGRVGSPDEIKTVNAEELEETIENFVNRL